MSDQDKNSIAEAVSDAAGEQLGVESWDRPAIFREVADAASKVELTYWIVLVLSGGIATLGVALNSSAVVIGAMLVAPLLGPMIGLALSLAMGDGRLAVQTTVIVAGSTLLVIATSALLTILLPFHEVTAEISARTRPTTLDLVIAIFSGLVGAVVTVGRGKRLSAAIPGVAISVALIPPLAVAGFGIGIGFNRELILGSLLLYGANLAGIVLSGMVVFLLVGMNRKEALETAHSWHERQNNRLEDFASRTPYVGSAHTAGSTLLRMVLVGGFVIALGFPLTASLREISREVRIERAVAEAAAAFDSPGRSSILDRQVSIGSRATDVRLRVATTEWFTAEDDRQFEMEASTRAGEPIRLELEQLPTTAGDLDQLAALFPARPSDDGPTVTNAPRPLADAISDIGGQLASVPGGIGLPDSVRIANLRLVTAASGDVVLEAVYQARDTLSSDAGTMLANQLRQTIGIPNLQVMLEHLSFQPSEVQTDE